MTERKPGFTHRRRKGLERPRATPPRYVQMVEAIDNGTFSLDMLDEEEILRGRLRNKEGDFRGRPALLIPQAMAVELVRRQQAIIAEQLGPLSDAAIKRLNQIVKSGNTTVHDGPLIQAVKLALEYGLGKPVEKVQVQADVKVTQYENVIIQSTRPVEEITAEVDDL